MSWNYIGCAGSWNLKNTRGRRGYRIWLGAEQEAGASVKNGDNRRFPEFHLSSGWVNLYKG
jgi:hypothetical protein